MINEVWIKVHSALELKGHLRNDELQRCLQELQSSPQSDDPEYFNLLGHIYYSMQPQQLLQAQESFKKALEIDPSYAHARLYLGHCYYDSKQYQVAEETFLLVNKKDLPGFLQMK